MRTILEDHVHHVHVEEAANGDAALDVLAHGFDVVVLDLSMPGRSGIDLLTEIKHRYPKLPVLIMSFHAEELFAVRALRAGAAGYLMKSAAPEELAAAVNKVVRGGRYVTEAVADRLAASIDNTHRAP
ncbi:MAG TPA: response regulator transcription factor, partial [Kofleriaceae bacterium]|nr:response regulator transcription factor [Kofleriaceae bacterium]